MAKITSVKEFGEYIQNNALVDPTELPKDAQVGWFGPSGTISFIDVGKPLPLDPYSTVLAIFHDETSYRLYTAPTAVPNPRPTEWKDRALGRWILNVVSPTFVVESFPTLDVMADAIVEEWNAVAGEIGGAEAELDAVIDYLEVALEAGQSGERAPSLMSLIEGLRAGDHHGDDDDDDDEDSGEDSPEDETQPQTEPASPPAATTSGAPAQEAKPQ